MIDEESINNMIWSVVREHHWPPEVIDGLYLDSADHFGLEFWYDDLIEVHKELKQKNR